MATDAAKRNWTFRDCGSRFASFFDRDRKGSGLDDVFGGMALGWVKSAATATLPLDVLQYVGAPYRVGRRDGVGCGVWTPLSVPAKTWKETSHEWPPRGVSEGNHFDVFYIIGSEYGSFCTNTSP